jgi:hypothetical protein
MCAEIDHTVCPTRLLRLPVALGRLLYLTRDPQEYLPLVIDQERESPAGTDNQTEDKRAHGSAPPDSPDYIQIAAVKPTGKIVLKSAIISQPRPVLRNAASF